MPLRISTGIWNAFSGESYQSLIFSIGPILIVFGEFTKITTEARAPVKPNITQYPIRNRAAQ